MRSLSIAEARKGDDGSINYRVLIGSTTNTICGLVAAAKLA